MISLAQVEVLLYFRCLKIEFYDTYPLPQTVYIHSSAFIQPDEFLSEKTTRPLRLRRMEKPSEHFNQ